MDKGYDANNTADFQDGFNRFLSLLDSNRELAGIRYESLRQRLIFFFRRNGCQRPEELVDKTVARVSGKLVRGESIAKIEAFCYGVAQLILKEERRASSKYDKSLADLAPNQEPCFDPLQDEKDIESDRLQTRKLECMRLCFQTMRDEDQRLIGDYVLGEDKNILAAVQKMTLKNLRVKIHRVRGRLRRCLTDCVKRAGYV